MQSLGLNVEWFELGPYRALEIMILESLPRSILYPICQLRGRLPVGIGNCHIGMLYSWPGYAVFEFKPTEKSFSRISTDLNILNTYLCSGCAIPGTLRPAFGSYPSISYLILITAWARTIPGISNTVLLSSTSSFEIYFFAASVKSSRSRFKFKLGQTKLTKTDVRLQTTVSMQI
jgi:hypothetical protein